MTVPCPVRDRTVPSPWLYRALSMTVPCPVRDRTVPCPWPYRALSVTVPCPVRDRTVPCPWPYRALSVIASGHCCYSTVKNTWQPVGRNATIHISNHCEWNRTTKRRSVEAKPHILYTCVLDEKEWPVSYSARFTLGENTGGKFWIPWNLSWILYYCEIYY